MAEKRKDFKEYGYEDERFESVISDCHNLHCVICSNVFKDPVMCKNEHCFCRACITENLKSSQSCPCCNQHLSVESLSDAPRILRNLLAELRIRCDYHKRGCEEFVQLGNLASHVATCTKAPVVCSNEECSSEMSRDDQARHESEECRFRKVKCRNCKEMDAMMHEIGASLDGLCERVMNFNINVNEQRSEMKTGLSEMKTGLSEMKTGLSEMKTGLSAMENRIGEVENKCKKVENSREEMQRKFEKFEIRFEKVGNQSHESFHDMKSTRSDQATQADLVGPVHVANNPTQKGYIVAGGYGRNQKPLNSVEIFDKSTNSWRQLQSMKKCRADASSVVYKGQLLVTGGISDGRNVLSSIEQFICNPNPYAPPFWSNFPVNLPRALRGHRSVVYNNRLLVIGGYDDEKKISNLIYEIQLNFPFNTKVLAKLPSSLIGCGVVLVDDKILIFGGGKTFGSSSVTMYDITKNEFKSLASLPYDVCNMAAVKHGTNAILCGGDGYNFRYDLKEYRNTVISYNIETQKSVMLPPMKDISSECCAVVDRNSLVVMGGGGKVEAIDVGSSKWRSHPSMNLTRSGFVAEIV